MGRQRHPYPALHIPPLGFITQNSTPPLASLIGSNVNIPQINSGRCRLLMAFPMVPQYPSGSLLAPPWGPRVPGDFHLLALI